MIPRQRASQTLEQHQDEVAAWCGYPNRDALNFDHDRLHAALCRWLGVTSHALRDAAGETLTRDEAFLASLEETATMHLQRFMAHTGAQVPQ